jgi:hypothetical protein
MLRLGRRLERGEPVHCGFCRAQIALRLEQGLHPAPRELVAAGAVPMRRVGWFCSRRCVGAYEFRFRVILEPEPFGLEPQGECSGSGSN